MSKYKTSINQKNYREAELSSSPSEAEGTDPNNSNSDIWHHTNGTGMMKDDEKTTNHLVKFLKSIGYEMPDVEIIEEKRK